MLCNSLVCLNVRQQLVVQHMACTCHMQDVARRVHASDPAQECGALQHTRQPMSVHSTSYACWTVDTASLHQLQHTMAIAGLMLAEV